METLPASHVVYILDLVGTFAFAVYGADVALRNEFDLFGISVSALLTALGGGTLRELILGNVPFYFSDNMYIAVILLGCVSAITTHLIFGGISKHMLKVDAVGLSTFAFIGAARAAEKDLGAFAIIFLATITAVGGGVVRDIAIRKVPEIFYRDIYASPAIALGIVYAIFGKHMHKSILIYTVISCAFVLRLIAMHFGLSLWRPGINKCKKEARAGCHEKRQENRWPQ